MSPTWWDPFMSRVIAVTVCGLMLAACSTTMPSLDFMKSAPQAESLEPISKSPEEDNEASELYEAEEVVGVVFPTDEDATLPLNRRSCVGGLLLLLRCGAIISMPSLRNSSSSGSLS